MIVYGYGIGSALLAVWIVVRYPGRDWPVSRAFVLVGCSEVLLALVGRATAAAQSVAGRPVALLAVVLPLFTFAFWSGICLARAVIDRRV